MTQKHVCRKGGKRVGPLNGPPWCAPGGLVRLAGQDNWGRVQLRWRCCDSYDVAVAEFGEQEAGVLRAQPVDAFEDAWDAYPANLPPKGYPVPKPYPMSGVTEFSGPAKQDHG